MNKELISKATRNEFREVMTDLVLRDIDRIFEEAGLAARTDFTPPVGGQRRSLVEQYYANINFSNSSDVRKIVAVYEELLLRLNSESSQWADQQKRKELINKLLARMERDGFEYENKRFVLDSRHLNSPDTPSLVALTAESIAEHVGKARVKIEQGDSAGAITNAYTLVEAFLKEILRKQQAVFKENEGDIKSLYTLVSEQLNLNPKGEHLESHLRTILQGLKSLVVGLYEVANKASDRHARRYNPAPHHAKLAVNTALTLCEFLLDSFSYQEEKKAGKANG